MPADRIQHLALSPTFRINAIARNLKAQGVDVLDFSVGEPDFPTPEPIKRAGKEAIDRNLTRYTANEGTLELRQAIAEKLRRDNGLDYATDCILVSPGAKASLYNAVMALFDPGDPVLVPAPYWVTYPEQLRLAGAVPVVLETDETAGFKLRPEQIAAAPPAKGIFLNYPSNPTGACYSREELEGIAAACVAKGLWVIADEIYEKLLYDGKAFVSIAACGASIRERTVVVNGMSKAFAMTGWRLGYAAGPKAILEAMGKVQSHATSHPASMAQYAGAVALRDAGDAVAAMAREFQARRDAVVRRLEGIPGLTCVRPDGAFYVFPNVSGLFGRTIAGRTLTCGQDVAELLLESARVAVVPGEAFGSARHIRISYSCSIETLDAGLDRIAETLA